MSYYLRTPLIPTQESSHLYECHLLFNYTAHGWTARSADLGQQILVDRISELRMWIITFFANLVSAVKGAYLRSVCVKTGSTGWILSIDGAAASLISILDKWEVGQCAVISGVFLKSFSTTAFSCEVVYPCSLRDEGSARNAFISFIFRPL